MARVVQFEALGKSLTYGLQLRYLLQIICIEFSSNLYENKVHRRTIMLKFFVHNTFD